MTNSRTIHISLDHLTAELLAFPFASRQCLESPISELNLSLHGATGRFWRKTEKHFARHFPNLCLDELIAMRNAAWFGPANGMEATPRGDIAVPLDVLLRASAEQWLSYHGSVARPKLPKTQAMTEAADPAARRAWRWIMFSMPSDLMLAGLSQNGQGPTRVDMISPAVDALLRSGGYAETHLHMGAAFDFSTAWAAVVNCAGREQSAASPGMAFSAFRSPGARYSEGRDLAQWLVRGCIVRFVLAAFLVNAPKSTPLKSFLQNFAYKDSWAVSAVHRNTLADALLDLRKGHLAGLPIFGPESVHRELFARFQGAYNALAKVSIVDQPDRLDGVQSLDPVAQFFKVHGHEGPSVQLQFLWRGLHYLLSNPDDIDFADLFWQAERVRGQVYRHCIQRPLTPGLMNFIRFYERKSPVLRLTEGVELESSGVLGGVGHGLRSLEVRTSPVKDADGQLQQLRNFRNRARKLRSRKLPSGDVAAKSRLGRMNANAWSQLEFGLVLHFLKSRGGASDLGLPKALDFGNHADPLDSSKGVEDYPNDGFRWRGYIKSHRKASMAIGSAIEKEPALLTTLRALDVCRDEHGVPCWVVSPLFEAARQRISAAAEQSRSVGGVELPPLRTTIHVGEDFVHLASGLRYMDEAIEYLKLAQGDRVGHGLALGIQPDVWATETTRMAMPLEDRWLDLIWERRLHGYPGARFTNDRRTFVEDEIIRLSKAIFAQGPNQQEDDFPWTVANAMQLVAWLHDAKKLSSLGFPDGELRDKPSKGLEEQLERYLCGPNVYRRCRSVEWVCVNHDRDALVELQRLVRKRYSELGITIEVNPISNLLVGNLTDLESHPLWRLAPGLGSDHGATLRICVGSDDPFPFATTLPEEYQLLYDSLVLAGRSHAEAREWLQMIQRFGQESRFTLPSVD